MLTVVGVVLQPMAMLAEAFHVKDTSRLGCQILMTTELDGLEIVLAPQE